MIGNLNGIEEKAILEFKQILLRTLDGNLKKIRLFGSKVRGDFHPESDIDVLVLIRYGDYKLRDQIVDVSTELSLKYEVLISPKVLNEEEFSKNLRWQTAFIKNVQQEGIDI